MLDVMAFILMALAAVAGDDGKRPHVTIDILQPKKGLIGSLLVKRTPTGFTITTKSASGERVIPFERDAASPHKYTAMLGSQKVLVDLTPLMAQLKDLARTPRQTLTYKQGERAVPISLARSGALLYVAAGDRSDLLVRR